MNNGRINLYASPSAGGSGAALGNGRKADPSTFPGFAFEQASEKNFQADMLRGNWAQTPLSDGFFSQKNLDTIQNDIRRSVYDRKGYLIDTQSVDELKMIMRAIFYQYSKNLDTNIQTQIADLNTLVLNWSVPHILSAVEHHMYYLKDINTYPVPLSLPVQVSRAGTKSKALNPFM